MERNFEKSPGSSLFAIVAIALFLCSCPLTRSFQLAFPDTSGVFHFTIAQLASALCCAAVLLARDLRVGCLVFQKSAVAGTFGVNGGATLVLLVSTGISLPTSLNIAAGIASGICLPIVLSQALLSLSTPNLGENMITASAIFGLSGLLYWGISLTPLLACQILLAAALVVGSVGAYQTIVKFALYVDESDTRSGERPFARLRELLSVAGVPLIGTLAFGVFIKAGIPLQSPRPTLFGLDEELLLFILGAVALGALGFVQPKRSLYASIYQVVVPAFASIILICLSFPMDSTPFAFGGVLVVFATAFVLLFAVAVIATTIGSEEASPATAVCLVLGAYCVGRLLGALFHSSIAPAFDAYIVDRIVLTLFLAAILLVAATQGRHRSTGTSLDGPRTISENIDLACAVLSDRHDLSPREAEVMKHLARGYSPAHTAQALVISESTARTHASRIYRKLGIGTREELIALVDSVSNLD